MTYKLHIANKRYSSWSMRPWLVFKVLDIPFEEALFMFKPGYRQPDFLAFSPSGKVPCLHDSAHDKFYVWDSLAIVEYIAEKHAGVWPSDPTARAFARCAASEMHSSFEALREECGMNVGLRIELPEHSDGLKRDLARLETLFTEGLTRFGGPWLAGAEFTAADAFYAPVACRFKTYGITFPGPAGEYVERLFEHPSVQEWVQAGIFEKDREPTHEQDAARPGRRILADLSAEQ
ncbi:unnamed protein product [Clonostachys rhizophaga]|uniref:GST N-terminal domain-containing protein n=1 Tax=Clonostachys rhizophaga TaxID=160324 RepID=A0A9N9YHE8_9HYPO|nr:unnamed protein product [Clonostachys rhizophaga]